MDTRRKKLFYRASHRGIKEMDLILTAFAKSELAGMDPVELDQFEALLEVPDQDLYYWIIGATEAAAEHQTDVLRRISHAPPIIQPKLS